MRGAGSFVATAQSYADYASAMRRKLLQEIARRPGGLIRPPTVLIQTSEKG